MVNKKSLANLKPNKKGRPKGTGGETWASLIVAYRNTPAPPEFAATLGKGVLWRDVLIAAAFRHAAGGNAAILRELFQRSEPQDAGIAVNGKIEIEIIRTDNPLPD